MGGSLKASESGGGKRRRKRGRAVPMADINITPFVDVMLVLLVIFMVTAPMMTSGVPIELPKTKANNLGSQQEPLTIVVSKEGKIFFKDTSLALDEIVPTLQKAASGGLDEDIYIKGDQETSYGLIAKVMGHLSGAGFRRINFVMDAE